MARWSVWLGLAVAGWRFCSVAAWLSAGQDLRSDGRLTKATLFGRFPLSTAKNEIGRIAAEPAFFKEHLPNNPAADQRSG